MPIPVSLGAARVAGPRSVCGKGSEKASEAGSGSPPVRNWVGMQGWCFICSILWHALDVHLGVMCRGTKGVVKYRWKGGTLRLQEAGSRQVQARSVDISQLRHADPHLSSSP